MVSYSENTVTCHFLFFLECTRKSASDHYRQWDGEWGLTSVGSRGGGGGI